MTHPAAGRSRRRPPRSALRDRLEFGLGHNGGPPLDTDEDPGAVSWRGWCWNRAHKKAWKTPPREIALRRLARAEELGMTYRAYTLEIKERGKYL